MKKNGVIIGLTFLIMLTFTELVGLNINIAFISFIIITAILVIMLVNIKLKEKFVVNSVRVITSLLLIGCALLSVFIIRPAYGCSAILAAIVFYKFIDKINYKKIDFEFLKGFVVYYIIPLIVMLLISRLYLEGIHEISKLKSMWMVNYIEFALIVTYEKIIVDIIIVILVLSYKDILKTKINISINSTLIYILSIVITVVILSIKIVLTFVNMGIVDDRTLKLSIAIYNNNLQEYYELDFNPNLDVQENNINEEEKNYMMSINDILTKGVFKWAELFYKTNTVSIKEAVTNRNISKKEALTYYKDKSEAYIEMLDTYKDNLYLQVVCYIVIYLSNIIGVTIIYIKEKKNIE